MSSELLKTPLYEEHIRNGAKMVDFAGWEMPIKYSSIIEEVKKVRNDVGIFDVSHMGEIFIEGPEAVPFVDYIITNDFMNIKYGEAVYSPMCNEEGGIIDDLIAYKVDRETAYLVVNAANKDKDLEWIKSLARNFNVKVTDRSMEYALIAVQGPNAEKKLQDLVNVFIDEVPFYHFKEGRVRGVKAVISRTGYTGEDGFELMTSWDTAVVVWRSLIEYGMTPSGLGARDVLRLEASYLLYGNDMDETTNPLEAGLRWTIKFKKERFVGKDALLKIKEAGIERKLVGMILEGKNIARHGYSIYKDGEVVGNITSGTFSPTLNKSIALGYVRRDLSKAGTKLEVKIKDKTVMAEIVRLPFYRGSVKSKK